MPAAAKGGGAANNPPPKTLVVEQARLPLIRETGEEERRKLENRLNAYVTGRVTLTITDNVSSIILVKRGAGQRYRVRLHHMFLEAPPSIVLAVARFVMRSDHEASAEINAFIDENASEIRAPLPGQTRRPKLQPQGRYFNLERIYQDLNLRFFGDRVEADITWGRKLRARARRHRSVKLGSYSIEDRLIRLHRSLDRSFVPLFFIESVVFHEMLHQLHGSQVVNGRNHFHTPAFRADEARYPYFEKAREWERAKLSRLLHY